MSALPAVRWTAQYSPDLPAFVLHRDGWCQNVVHVTVPRELSIPTRTTWKAAVVAELEKGAEHVVVDLSGCGYVDSSGLGVLASIRRKVVTRGGVFAVVNVNEDMLELFAATRMDDVFLLYRAAPAEGAER